MHSTLFIALLAGLGGMLGWGFADFCAKKTIDSIGAIKSLVWAHTFGTSLFVVLALGQVLLLKHTVHIPTTAGAWLGLVFFGVLQMVVYWLVYVGFGKGQLAVLNPVFASYSGLVALVSIVAYGEALHVLSGIGLIAIFAGIILLNIDIQGLRSRQLTIAPGLKEVGLASLLAAGWTIGWDKFVSGQDALAYALLMYAFMTLAALALARFMKVGLRGVEPGLRKYLLLIGAGETVAYLAISWGYSATPLTSVVALVSGAFSLPTLVLAYVFLKERVSRLQVGAICGIIAGIVMVALK
jgi:drug/metabolite transporter (DMT)-like permease